MSLEQMDRLHRRTGRVYVSGEQSVIQTVEYLPVAGLRYNLHDSLVRLLRNHGRPIIQQKSAKQKQNLAYNMSGVTSAFWKSKACNALRRELNIVPQLE